MRGPDYARLGILTTLLISGCNTAITPQSPEIESIGSTPTSTMLPPLPTSTFIPTETQIPYTWMSVDQYATAANGTAYAVETQMPPEMPNKIIDAYRDITIRHAYDYSTNGKWYYDIPFGGHSGGSAIIEVQVDGQDFVLLGLSGHQLSMESHVSKFANNLLNVDLADGKPLVSGHIESLEIGGSTISSDKVVTRFVYNPGTGEDWGFVLIRKADIADPKVYEGALKKDDLSFKYPTNDMNYFSLCKPGVTDHRQVTVVNGQMLGEYLNLVRISNIRNAGCSGSAVYFTENNEPYLVGPAVSSLVINEADGSQLIADEALVYPIFSRLGEVGFNNLLKDMASKFQN